MRARGGGGDHRLGVVGDAEAGARDHVEIVGAVADRQGLASRSKACALDQGRELGVAAEDRLGDPAGQLAVRDQSRLARFS